MTATPKSAHQQHLSADHPPPKSPSTTHVPAPRLRRATQPEPSGKQYFLNALDITVRAMRELVEVRMEHRLGTQWSVILGDRLGIQFSRNDLLSYKNALIAREPEQRWVEACFHVPLPRWRNELFDATRARNELIGHPDDVVSFERAESGIWTLYELAIKAELGCSDEIEEVLERLDHAAKGGSADGDNAILEHLNAESQRTAQEAKEAIDQSREARAVADEAARKIAELEDQLRNTLSEFERLQAVQRADSGAIDRAIVAEAELAAAKAELEQKELASARAEDARVRAEAARREAEESQRRAEESARSAANPIDIGEIVAQVIARTAAGKPPEQQRPPKHTPDGRRVRLGQKWPFPRGDDEWTLLTRICSLQRLNDGVTLEDVVGSAKALQIVLGFLSIRPDGGRVWIDTDGDACTYKGHRYVYLGRINELADGVPGPIQPPPKHSKQSRTAKAAVSRILPDPATVPRGTELRGIKAADGLHRQPHLWVAKRGKNGGAYWVHSDSCVH